jgi:hypothetical protein
MRGRRTAVLVAGMPRRDLRDSVWASIGFGMPDRIQEGNSKEGGTYVVGSIRMRSSGWHEHLCS